MEQEVEGESANMSGLLTRGRRRARGFWGVWACIGSRGGWGSLAWPRPRLGWGVMVPWDSGARGAEVVSVMGGLQR